MILDTSAVVAILFAEPDAAAYENAIAQAWPRRISAASLVEAAIVIESRGGPAAALKLDQLLERAQVEIMAITPEQAASARNAWRRFGKGNHPAALNFGDCFAYALAKITGEPLLFKGGDFGLTDVTAA